MKSWIKNNVIFSDRYTNGEWVIRNRSSLISILMKNLDENSDTILDLGCGEGTYSAQFLQTFSKCSILIGIDISRESIRLAKVKQSREKTEFMVADGQNLPFKDKSFGAVISKDVLHHADRPRQVLKEIIRISTGPSVVIEANKSNPIMVLNEKYGHHHLTSQQLTYLAKTSGASNFIMFSSYDYPFTMRLPSLNPIVVIWNLSISLLLITCNKIPLISSFFSLVIQPLLVNSYNGLSINSLHD